MALPLLMSSHILAEIEQIADTIGIINNGRLVEEISMENINQNSHGVYRGSSRQ